MIRYTLSLAALAISFTTMAQSEIKFGVKAGAINSTIRGDAMQSLNSVLDYTNGLVTSKSKTSYYAGITAEFPVADNIFVEPGVIYSEKGYEMGGEFNLKGLEFLGANAKARLQLNYIDIPVLLKYKNNGLVIFGGPQLSYLAKGNINTRAGLLGINLLNKDFDVSSTFNKWDAAITAGIGYEISPNIAINGAYDYGLTKIDANRSANAYNSAFRVGMSFTF